MSPKKNHANMKQNPTSADEAFLHEVASLLKRDETTSEKFRMFFGYDIGDYSDHDVTRFLERKLVKTGGIRNLESSCEKTIFQGQNNAPIPYNKDTAAMVYHELQAILKSNEPHLAKPNPKIPLEIWLQVKKYGCAIKAYLDSSNPVMSKDFLIEGVKDLNFASVLKGIRLKSFLISSNSYLLEEDAKLQDLPSFEIKDIGDVFNFNYSFFWELQEDEKDYMLGHTSVTKYTDDQRKKIHDILLAMLPDDIETISEEEVLLKLSGSSSFSGKVWSEKEHSNSFSNKPLKGRRALVQTGPGTSRDAVVIPVDQVNSVTLIEKQCMIICEKLPHSAYRRDFDKIRNDIEKYFNKYIYFYDRDIEKEGITKPREFIQVILDTLEEKYPYMPAWKYKDIYSGYSLFVEEDGKEHLHRMERGHGLGMGNALTTIMQIILFKICLERMSETDSAFGEVAAMFYNDDSTVGFMEESDIVEFEDIDAAVCEDYSVRRKPKKTHSGRGCVFLENYWLLNTKESYLRYFELLSFCCADVSVAKGFYNSFVITNYYNNILEDLISFYGYEFFPREWEHPYLFGGWVTPNFKGVDFSFFEESRMLCYESLKAYFVISELPGFRIKEKGDRIVNDPLSQLYGPTLNLNGKESEFFYNQPIRFFKAKFRKEKQIKNIANLKCDYFIKRFNTYREINLQGAKYEIFLRIFREYSQKFIDKDVFPPQEEIYLNDVEFDANKMNYPYQSENSRLSYIKYYNPEKFSRKNKIVADPSFKGKARAKITQGDYLVLRCKLDIMKSPLEMTYYLENKPHAALAKRHYVEWNNPEVMTYLCGVLFQEIDKIPGSIVKRSIAEKPIDLEVIESLPYTSKFRKLLIASSQEERDEIINKLILSDVINLEEELIYRPEEPTVIGDIETSDDSIMSDEDPDYDEIYLKKPEDLFPTTRQAWDSIRVRQRVVDTQVLRDRLKSILAIYQKEPLEELSNEHNENDASSRVSKIESDSFEEPKDSTEIVSIERPNKALFDKYEFMRDMTSYNENAIPWEEIEERYSITTDPQITLMMFRSSLEDSKRPKCYITGENLTEGDFLAHNYYGLQVQFDPGGRKYYVLDMESDNSDSEDYTMDFF